MRFSLLANHHPGQTNQRNEYHYTAVLDGAPPKFPEAHATVPHLRTMLPANQDAVLSSQSEHSLLANRIAPRPKTPTAFLCIIDSAVIDREKKRNVLIVDRNNRIKVTTKSRSITYIRKKPSFSEDILRYLFTRSNACPVPARYAVPSQGCANAPRERPSGRYPPPSPRRWSTT